LSPTRSLKEGSNGIKFITPGLRGKILKMSAQKKKISGHGSAPKGDCEPSLNPPILFVPPKVDDDDQPPTVDIMIKKNASKGQPRIIPRRGN
jgi:hypothetical protein